MRSQCLCNITYTAALLTHSLYGLPVLIMQTLILSFRHVLCSFPSSFAFYGKKISVSEFLHSARSSFLLFPIKKENRQRLYNLLSIFILKLINFPLYQFTDNSILLYLSEEKPRHKPEFLSNLYFLLFHQYHFHCLHPDPVLELDLASDPALV